LLAPLHPYNSDGGRGLGQLSEKNTSVYFPHPTAIEPFAMAFVEMMFAHAEFEKEVCRLQGLITGDPEFGEHGCHQWPPKERPKKMAKLIKKHLGEIPETAEIRKILTDVIDPCDRRNHLTHGHWWRYDFKSQVIQVRGARQRNGRIEWRNYTELDIGSICVHFRGRAADLHQLCSQIENRALCQV
jgi:hypothetical protein